MLIIIVCSVIVVSTSGGLNLVEFSSEGTKLIFVRIVITICFQILFFLFLFPFVYLYIFFLFLTQIWKCHMKAAC